MSKGVATRTLESIEWTCPGQIVSLLPPLGNQHRNFEYTIPADRMHSVKGYTSGDSYSCAFDTALFLGRCGAFGRIQGDAIPLSTFNTLTAPELAVRLYMVSPHHFANLSQRNQYRYEVQKAFKSDKRTGYNGLDKYYSPNDVFAWGFGSFRHLSFTATKAYQCCSGCEMIPHGQPVRRISMITIQVAKNVPGGSVPLNKGRTIGALIQGTAFGCQEGKAANLKSNGEPLPPLTRCKAGSRCSQVYQTHTKVLDRMPGKMWVSLGWGSPALDHSRAYFDDITITCCVGKDDNSICLYNTRYRVEGVAIFTQPAHFVARYRGTDCVWHYDGLDDGGGNPGGVYDVKDWDSGLGEDDCIVSLLYRIVDIDRIG